jgi:hypothetical protein
LHRLSSPSRSKQRMSHQKWRVQSSHRGGYHQ